MKRRDILMRAGALGVASAMPTSVFADRSGFYVPAEEVLHECTFMQWPMRAVGPRKTAPPT